MNDRTIPEHRRWSSLQELAGSVDQVDGMHTVGTGPGRVDLLSLNDGLAAGHDQLLVVFNGAVTGRETKTGPFFSGRGLAAAAQIPAVCIGDPTVADDPQVGLAWYRGSGGSGFLPALEELLQWLAGRTERGVILLGGSGGGFASLDLGARLGDRAAVIAWNPQVDLVDYTRASVQAYLSSAHGVDLPEAPPEGWKEAARRALRGAGVRHDLYEAYSRGEVPGRMLVIQNASDWHVRAHLARLAGARDVTSTRPDGMDWDDEHIFRLRDYGTGHIPPETGELLALVRAVRRQPGSSLARLWDQQQALGQIAHHAPTGFPVWLAHAPGAVGDLLQLRPDHVGRLVPSLGTGAQPDKRMLRLGYTLRRHDDVIATAAGPLGSAFPLQLHDGWTSLSVQVEDGFGNTVLERVLEPRDVV